MISFGELRRQSVQWGVLVDVVERAYALDWLVKVLYGNEALAERLVLRDETALAKAYFAGEPPLDVLDVWWSEAREPNEFLSDWERAANTAAGASGPRLAPAALAKTQAQFEFTGPLGRRSAAQPHLTLRLYAGAPRRPAFSTSLLSPFSDLGETRVRAAALEELAAERIAVLSRAPRARDVYDLWKIVTRGADRLDRAAALDLTVEIARAKNLPPLDAASPIPEAHRAILARNWAVALKGVKGLPEFGEAENAIRTWLG